MPKKKKQEKIKEILVELLYKTHTNTLFIAMIADFLLKELKLEEKWEEYFVNNLFKEMEKWKIDFKRFYDKIKKL